ncbi:MAG: hypothetical protein ABI769_20065 [Pseudomonadota bacterium]
MKVARRWLSLFAAMTCAAHSAGPGLSPAQAAATLALDFCAHFVGGTPADIRTAASRLDGLIVNDARPLSGLDPDLLAQLADVLDAGPADPLQVVSYGTEGTRGAVFAVVRPDAMKCFVVARGAPDSLPALRARLATERSRWTLIEDPGEYGPIWNGHNDSNGPVSLLAISATDVTVFNIHVPKVSEDFARLPVDLPGFAADVVKACSNLVLSGSKVDFSAFAPRFRVARELEDGNALLRTSNTRPASNLVTMNDGGGRKCTFILFEQDGPLAQLKQGIIAAFLALPGAEAFPAKVTTRWRIRDAAVKRAAILSFEENGKSLFVEIAKGSTR